MGRFNARRKKTGYFPEQANPDGVVVLAARPLFHFTFVPQSLSSEP